MKLVLSWAEYAVLSTRPSTLLSDGVRFSRPGERCLFSKRTCFCREQFAVDLLCCDCTFVVWVCAFVTCQHAHRSVTSERRHGSANVSISKSSRCTLDLPATVHSSSEQLENENVLSKFFRREARCEMNEDLLAASEQPASLATTALLPVASVQVVSKRTHCPSGYELVSKRKPS